MKEHILVVDDEYDMRSLLTLALNREGFLVTTATGATEALALFAVDSKAKAPFDLLLTDFNMASITGLELVDALRRVDEQLPCLLMSGSPNKLLAAEALSHGCAGFIKKPFRLSVMLEYIHKTLEVPTEECLSNMGFA